MLAPDYHYSVFEPSISFSFNISQSECMLACSYAMIPSWVICYFQDGGDVINPAGLSLCISAWKCKSGPMPPSQAKHWLQNSTNPALFPRMSPGSTPLGWPLISALWSLNHFLVLHFFSFERRVDAWALLKNNCIFLQSFCTMADYEMEVKGTLFVTHQRKCAGVSLLILASLSLKVIRQRLIELERKHAKALKKLQVNFLSIFVHYPLLYWTLSTSPVQIMV